MRLALLVPVLSTVKLAPGLTRTAEVAVNVPLPLSANVPWLTVVDPEYAVARGEHHGSRSGGWGALDVIVPPLRFEEKATVGRLAILAPTETFWKPIEMVDPEPVTIGR